MMVPNYEIKKINPVVFHNQRMSGHLTKFKIHKKHVIWERTTFDYIPRESIFYVVPRDDVGPIFRIIGEPYLIKKFIKKNSRNLYELALGIAEL